MIATKVKLLELDEYQLWSHSPRYLVPESKLNNFFFSDSRKAKKERRKRKRKKKKRKHRNAGTGTAGDALLQLLRANALSGSLVMMLIWENHLFLFIFFMV